MDYKMRIEEIVEQLKEDKTFRDFTENELYEKATEIYGEEQFDLADNHRKEQKENGKRN